MRKLRNESKCEEQLINLLRSVFRAMFILTFVPAMVFFGNGYRQRGPISPRAPGSQSDVTGARERRGTIIDMRKKRIWCGIDFSMKFLFPIWPFVTHNIFCHATLSEFKITANMVASSLNNALGRKPAVTSEIPTTTLHFQP